MPDQVEVIRAHATPDGCEGILAIFVFRNDNGRTSEEPPVHFYTPCELTLQYARIRHPRGHVVPKHRHLRVAGRLAERTQEVILVRDGIVEVEVFDGDGTPYAKRLLSEGDAVVLVAGAHLLNVLKDCVLDEVKTGPYPGRDKDKVEL